MVSAANQLKESVQLYVSGRKLKDLDTWSKSDPKCYVYEKRGSAWL